jgi:hypothetical protein
VKHPVRLPLISLAMCFALGATNGASAFELPADLPMRSEGLWIIDQKSTISDGETTIEIQKIWNACLDNRSDRALHELEVREQQSNIASLNKTCEEPQPSISGNVLFWTMHCSGPLSAGGKTGVSDVRHTTTFVTGDETRAESVIVNRDKLIPSHGQFFTHMKRVGACSGESKPGDMVLMHWRANGEETLKARQIRNVYDEIANHKTLTASPLGR